MLFLFVFLLATYIPVHSVIIENISDEYIEEVTVRLPDGLTKLKKFGIGSKLEIEPARPGLSEAVVTVRRSGRRKIVCREYKLQINAVLNLLAKAEAKVKYTKDSKKIKCIIINDSQYRSPHLTARNNSDRIMQVLNLNDSTPPLSDDDDGSGEGASQISGFAGLREGW